MPFGDLPQNTYLQKFSDIWPQDTQDGIITRFLAKHEKHLPKHLKDFSGIKIYMKQKAITSIQ